VFESCKKVTKVIVHKSERLGIDASDRSSLEVPQLGERVHTNEKPSICTFPLSKSALLGQSKLRATNWWLSQRSFDCRRSLGVHRTWHAAITN
jgi:hypothetical protein